MSAKTLLFNYAKRYPFRILASLLLGFSGAIFNGVGTTLIVPAVFRLLDNNATTPNCGDAAIITTVDGSFCWLATEYPGHGNVELYCGGYYPQEPG
jgi:hypothetical protein